MSASNFTQETSNSVLKSQQTKVNSLLSVKKNQHQKQLPAQLSIFFGVFVYFLYKAKQFASDVQLIKQGIHKHYISIQSRTFPSFSSRLFFFNKKKKQYP